MSVFFTRRGKAPQRVNYANVNITGTAVHGGIAHASVTINGTSYTAAAVVSVPVGTVITLQARGSQYGTGTITVNGSVVKSGTTGYMTYDYTVAGDVTIKLSGGKNSVSYVEVTTG